MRKILLSLMCLMAIYSTSFAQQQCDGPLEVTIEGSPADTPLSIEQDVITQPTCENPTGSISINITGGIPGYTVSWSQVGSTVEYSSDEDLTNAESGSYEVTVTDDIGCTTTLGPIELEDASGFDLEGVITGIECSDSNDGAISLTVSGGEGPYTYAWGPAGADGLDAAAQNQSGLSAGTYTVTVTDTGSGCQQIASYTIEETDPIIIMLAGVDPECTESGDGNGSITTTVEGGTAPYTFAWGPSGSAGLDATAQDQAGLSPGEYEVTVTDANNCTKVAEITLESSGDMAIATDSQTDPTCYEGNNGEIAVSVSGGNEPYTFNWTTEDGSGLTAASQNQTGLTAGTYRVEIEDANGCSTWEDIVLEGVDEILASVTVENPGCNVTGEGSITMDEVTGGTAPYTFAWTNESNQPVSSTDGNIEGLSPGEYTLVVTDAAKCTATFTHTIDEPMEITIATDLDQDLSCHANDPNPDGAISITASGGSGEYTYNWGTSNGSGLVVDAEDQTGLGGGTYYVTVTDANNPECSVIKEYVLDEPAALSIGQTVMPPNCAGDDGNIWIAVSGGTVAVADAYDYDWDGPMGPDALDGQQNPNVSEAGTYYLTVTDDNGCSKTAEMDVEMPDALTATAEETQTINCNGGTGTVTVTPVGGTAPSTYSTNGVDYQESNVFANLDAGSYNIFVKDDKNCNVIVSIEIEAPESLVASAAITEAISCDGESAVVEVTAEGGTAPYTYSVDGNTFVASGEFVDLAAGDYTFTVKDANDCEVTTELEITAPDALAASTDVTDAIDCSGDNATVEVLAEGGTAPYTYSIDGNTFVSTNEFTDLAAGNYTFTVEDASGCTTTAEVEIVDPGTLTAAAEVTDAIDCSGDNGSVTVTAEGGTAPYTYSIDGATFVSTNVFSDLAAGDYTISVQDGNECTTTVDITVTAPDALAATAEGTDPVCNGSENGSIAAAVTGGTAPYTYSIDGINFGEDSEFADLGAGTYTVTVQDANGCMTTVEVELEDPAPFTAGTCTTVQDLCQVSEGEIKVEVSGGVAPYTVNWTSGNGGTLNEASGQTITDPNGSIIFTGAEGGKTYSFSVTDSNGCSPQ